MSQWTDRHYNYTYKLTDRDIISGEIRVDAYFVAKVWKTGSKDDSGALWHCLKTIARFGDKNDVEREIKALYAQVKGLARSFDVELETAEDEGLSISSHTGEEIAVKHVMTEPITTNQSLWYPDSSGEWIEYDGSGQPVEDNVSVEVLLLSERRERYWVEGVSKAYDWYWNWDTEFDSARIVAYKVVE